MRHLPFFLFAAALACSPARAFDAARAGVAATASPLDSSAVRDAERKRAAAVSNRDIGTLRLLIGGEYYHVESNGRARTKTEFLQALARDDFKLSGYGVDDMEITLLGSGRAAVVTGRFHARMQVTDTVRQFRGRYVRVWTLYPEGWRNTLHQSTEIRPAGTAPDKRALPLQ
ncbi:nuclear transport factor 2 family protein [Massilia sp. ST3]|uniref:nuclear transport factor 2 family protein n=1 Tax=Massilia sp. ST3 TaxID=2824903 RepID=UPI001B8188ED|nr:nuclear transport factor 2 family protein [Massilia sp. ST3]MBQ5947027.1 nuclear transport factor 2 family protein [Massilia sp. ST3]